MSMACPFHLCLEEQAWNSGQGRGAWAQPELEGISEVLQRSRPGPPGV